MYENYHMDGKFVYPKICLPEVFCKKRLRPTTLFKKRVWESRFPVTFSKFLRKPFLQNISVRQSIKLSMKKNKNIKSKISLNGVRSIPIGIPKFCFKYSIANRKVAFLVRYEATFIRVTSLKYFFQEPLNVQSQF